MASRNLREYIITTLKEYVHHGPKREKDSVQWDVVITTYDTVSSEIFGPKGSKEKLVLFHPNPRLRGQDL
jgi:hypothetical protein